MKYISTRGMAPALSFKDVVLAGLASDGGLYVPESWPQITTMHLKSLKGASYTELAFEIFKPFIGSEIPSDDLQALINRAYASFDDPEVTPVKELTPGHYLMELFHGPTLAFKDCALQFLGQLFDYILAERNEKVTLLGATSGDTGSAAIAGCQGRENVQIFILHPHNRISEVQRRQMTTVLDENVHNIAVQGTFDDCQTMVKAVFNDLEFRKKYQLSAVNSINWARIMAQVVYYFYAALKLGAPEVPVCFAVPTGNFGNVYAGYVATRMGLPVEKLIVGTNKNDILFRYFKTGVMKTESVAPSLSPAMDIQVSSNFERLLFEMHDRDAVKVKAQMEEFQESGQFTMRVSGDAHLFRAYKLDDEAIKQTIKETFDRTGEMIDPHTAVGVAAAMASMRTNIVSLACAHPAKFPDAVQEMTHRMPHLPDHLADLFDREEQCDMLAASPDDLKTYIESHIL